MIWRKIEKKNWQKLSEILRNGKKHGKNVLNKLKFSLTTQLSWLKDIQQIRIPINCLYGFLMKLPEVEE